MGTSAFDPKLLLDATTDQANSTVRIPVPAREHLALITEVDIRSGSKDGRNWSFLDVTFEIDSPEVKQELGRDKVSLTQGIGLDFTSQGGLDYSKGKNVMLGRLREAVNLNEPGKPFGFRMLVGRPVKILVTHAASTKAGAQPGDVFENVSAFVRA
jgi:hypothetical protein